MALSGLVAYDSSDNESGSEQDDQEIIKAIIPSQKTALKTNPDVCEDEDGDVPKPSEKERKLAEIAKKEKENLSKLSGLHKLAQKKNGKVIIGIPSLAEFEDDNEESKKTKKLPITVQKGQSKLFAKLPPPKNSHYAPLTEEPAKPAVPNPVASVAPTKKSIPLIPQSVLKRETKKDSDDEDETSGNFFTINEPELPAIPQHVNIAESYTHTLPKVMVHSEEAIAYQQIPANQLYNMAATADSDTPQPTDLVQMELDEAALQALEGSSGMKRKLPDDAQIIDVKQEKLTYDPSMSFVKAISEEQNPSTGEEFTYNKLQKKKHQITWLAAQAKAKEVELKNQWAANKNSRKQTQAKYGF